MEDNQKVKAIVQKIRGNIIRDMMGSMQMDAEEAAKFQFGQMVKSGVPSELANEIIKLAVEA